MFLKNIDKPYAQMIILGLLLAFNGYHLCAVYGALTHIKEWYYYIPVAFACICIEIGIFYATRNKKDFFVYAGAFIASLFNVFYVIIKDVQNPPTESLLSAPSIQYWGAIAIGVIISVAFGCMPIYFAEYLNSSIDEELKGVESENETIAELRQKLASLDKDLATLDETKESLTKAESDLAKVRQTLSEKEDDLTRLAKDLTKYSETCQELLKVQQELAEANRKLSEVGESSTSLDKNLAETNRRLSEVTEQNKTLAIKLSDLDKEKQGFDKVHQDFIKAQDELNSANLSKKQLQSKLDTQETELKGLRSKADFVALNGDISYEQYAAAINKITQNKGKEDFIPNILVHKSELPRVIEFSKPKTK